MYTVTEVEAFYDATSAAYLKAVKAKEFSHGGSQVSFSKQNQEVDALRKEMDYWKNELESLNAGGGVLEGRLVPSYDQ